MATREPLPKPVHALNDITMSPYCEYLCQGHVTKNDINTNGPGECSVRDSEITGLLIAHI